MNLKPDTTTLISIMSALSQKKKADAAEYAEKVIVLEDRVVMIQPSRPEKENLGPNTFRRPSQAGENGEQCVLS